LADDDSKGKGKDDIPQVVHWGYCTIAVKEAMARSQDIYFQGEKQT
jgi:hypothetical protein